MRWASVQLARLQGDWKYFHCIKSIEIDGTPKKREFISWISVDFPKTSWRANYSRTLIKWLGLFGLETFQLCFHTAPMFVWLLQFAFMGLTYQHSDLKSAVLTLCTRNFYLMKILFFKKNIDIEIMREYQGANRPLHFLNLPLPLTPMGAIKIIYFLYQFIAFAFRLRRKISPQSCVAVLRTAAASIATTFFGVFCKFV